MSDADIFGGIPEVDKTRAAIPGRPDGAPPAF